MKDSVSWEEGKPVRWVLWLPQLTALGELSVSTGRRSPGGAWLTLNWGEGQSQGRQGSWSCTNRVPERRELHKGRELQGCAEAWPWVFDQSTCVREVPGKEPCESIRVNRTRNNICAHQLDWKTSEFMEHWVEYSKGLASVGRISPRLEGALDLPNTYVLVS